MKKTVLIFHIMVGLLPYLEVYSKELSHAQITTSSRSTSDNDSLSTVSFSQKNHRRNIFWPYQQGKPKALDFNIGANFYSGKYQFKQLNGQRLAFTLGKKQSHKLYYDFTAGLHTYKIEKSLSKKTVTAESNILIKRSKFQLHLSYLRDYEYQNFKLLEDIYSPLTSNSFSSLLRYNISNQLSFNINQKTTFFSDNNNFYKTSTDITYDNDFSIIEYNMGLGTSIATSSKDKVNYYSPKNTKALGPRIGFNIEMNEDISLSNDTSYDFVYSQDKESSRDLWTSTSLAFFNRNSHNISFKHSTSIAFESEIWRENTFTLSANLFL